MTDGLAKNPLGEPIVVHGISTPPASTNIVSQSSLAEKTIVASQTKSSVLIAELNKLAMSSDSLESMIRGCKGVICQFADAKGLWMSQRG